MLKDDQATLESLVKEYSLSQVTQALSQVALKKAGELVDLQLNRNAKEWTKYSLLLEELSEMIEE
jgi:hypothetical protein